MPSLTAEQAIFTSVRTPMGEGYRIIAASKGVRAEEKQVITRTSPSHGGLCDVSDAVASGTAATAGPLAVARHPNTAQSAGATNAENDSTEDAIAFYPLPSGRLCFAISTNAGAEHTARGGQRIYTHNVIIDEADFAAASFDPFAIFAAIRESQAAEPQLKPAAVLPELELHVHLLGAWNIEQDLAGLVEQGAAMFALERILDSGNVVIHRDAGWADVAKSLVLAIPGPLRQTIPFCAGLTYSVSRGHSITVLADHGGKTKTRVAGHSVEYISEADAPRPSGDERSWTKFVQRCWQSRRWDLLARRTSRAFSNCGPEARERLGRLFNLLDDLSELAIGSILSTVSERLQQTPHADEKPFVDELLSTGQELLLKRIPTTPAPQLFAFWPPLVQLVGSGHAGFEFAIPVVDVTLRTWATSAPIDATRGALDLTQASYPPSGAGQIDGVIAAVLQRLADWAQHQPLETLTALKPLCTQWTSVRGDCPYLARIAARCQDAADQSATPIW